MGAISAGTATGLRDAVRPSRVRPLTPWRQATSGRRCHQSRDRPPRHLVHGVEDHQARCGERRLPRDGSGRGDPQRHRLTHLAAISPRSMARWRPRVAGHEAGRRARPRRRSRLLPTLWSPRRRRPPCRSTASVSSAPGSPSGGRSRAPACRTPDRSCSGRSGRRTPHSRGTRDGRDTGRAGSGRARGDGRSSSPGRWRAWRTIQ